MVRSGQGQLLAERMADLSAVNETTFRVKLKEPFSLMLDMFATTCTPDLFIMRKREAETDPMQKIDQVVGFRAVHPEPGRNQGRHPVRL